MGMKPNFLYLLWVGCAAVLLSRVTVWSAEDEVPPVSPDGRWKLDTGKAAVGTGFAHLSALKGDDADPEFEKKAWEYFSKVTHVHSDCGWIFARGWEPDVLLLTINTSEHHNAAEKNVRGWDFGYRLKEQKFFIPDDVKASNEKLLMEDLVEKIPSPKGDFDILIFSSSEEDWIVSRADGKRTYLLLGGTGMMLGAEGSQWSVSLSPDAQWFTALVTDSDGNSSGRLLQRKPGNAPEYATVQKIDGVESSDFANGAWEYLASQTKQTPAHGLIKVLKWEPNAVQLGLFAKGDDHGKPWVLTYDLKEGRFIGPADNAPVVKADKPGKAPQGFPLTFRPQSVDLASNLPPDLAQQYPKHSMIVIKFHPATHPAGKDGSKLKPGEGSWLDRGMRASEPGVIRYLVPDADQSMLMHTLKTSEGPFTLQVHKVNAETLETVPLVSPELK